MLLILIAILNLIGISLLWRIDSKLPPRNYSIGKDAKKQLNIINFHPRKRL
mgnify:CR=1 FL=1